jgi:hypothetical protein
VRWLTQRGRDDEGQYVDVLLALWSYLDDESRDVLVRERPPSAPALLAAYRRARESAATRPATDRAERTA